MKCEGKCTEHQGKVKLVNVYDYRHNKDWGLYRYCESAIKDDQSKGLAVTQLSFEERGAIAREWLLNNAPTYVIEYLRENDN